MEQEFKQGYRMHCVLSNLNRLDIDRLDDADQERVEGKSSPGRGEAFSLDQPTATEQRPAET